MSKNKKYFVYFTLAVIGIILAFPFYWVISSSFKSRESISMNPPSFYPTKYKLESFKVESKDRVFTHDNKTWLKLLDGKDLFGINNSPKGAYYLLLEKLKPTQYVKWIPIDSVNSADIKKSEIIFIDSPVHSLVDSGKDIIIAARMVRQKETESLELLFIPIIEKGIVKEITLLKNEKHIPVTEFALRTENYNETLQGPEASYGSESIGFLTYLKNSFIISLLAVFGQLFSSSLAAYGFSRLQFKGRDFLFILLLATLMVPAQVTLVPLFSIYKSLGWVNTFLPLIVPHFTAGAFNVFLLRQYMLTLPKELDESALIDGCGLLKIFYKIILPNSIPVLIVVGLFTFVATWQDVMGPLMYLDNPELRTVPLGLEYFRSPYVDNRHLLLTGAVLSMLPIAILFVIFQRYIMSGIATTGLKA